MVQALVVKAQARDVVWVEARVEAEWAAPLPLGQAAIASAPNVVRRFLILLVSLVIKEAALNVEHK